MTNIDLTPFYRSFIGFDHLANLMDAAARNEKQPAYPPYNIELTGEDKYRITMAVAGFNQSELTIEVNQNNLTVSANKVADEQQRTYLHQGIAARSFERRFGHPHHIIGRDHAGGADELGEVLHRTHGGFVGHQAQVLQRGHPAVVPPRRVAWPPRARETPAATGPSPGLKPAPGAGTRPRAGAPPAPSVRAPAGVRPVLPGPGPSSLRCV